MKLKHFATPRALLVALLGAIIIVLVVSASSSAAAFSVFNPSWDGASGVQSTATQAGVETRVALSPDVYNDVDPPSTVAVVIGPTTTYTPSELAQIQTFVDQGGTLVVADDFGSGNHLLRGVGAESRLNGRLLRDPRNHGVTTAMPIASIVANDTSFSAANSVILNHGTVVETETGTVLAQSSSFSYLDRDRDGEIDENESLESYPVVVRETHGNGRIIVVSDGSVFINAMLEQADADNDAFTRALIADADLVVLDGTQTSSTPPVQTGLITLRSNTSFQAVLILLLSGLGAAIPALSWSSQQLRSDPED